MSLWLTWSSLLSLLLIKKHTIFTLKRDRWIFSGGVLGRTGGAELYAEDHVSPWHLSSWGNQSCGSSFREYLEVWGLPGPQEPQLVCLHPLGLLLPPSFQISLFQLWKCLHLPSQTQVKKKSKSNRDIMWLKADITVKCQKGNKYIDSFPLSQQVLKCAGLQVFCFNWEEVQWPQ